MPGTVISFWDEKAHISKNCLATSDNTFVAASYTGCPRRNVPDFGRVFLMLKYTDITQNTYVQS